MENNKKRKIIKIVIICIAILLLLGGVTYAVYKWRSTESIDVTINVADAHVTFYGGSDIVGELEPTLTKEEGIIKKVKIVSDTPYTKFSLHLLINTLPSQLQVESFIWEIYKNDELDAWDGDNFSGYSEEDDILLVDTENISYPEGDTYTLYIWIDGTEENDLNMMNKTIDFDLYATGYNATEEDIGTGIEYITNLYNNATKTPKTQTGSNMTYNYAELYNDEDYSGGLMNDRLGSMDNHIDSGNIRYYGANPKNYIYFNCTDYSDTTTCELWRIIGIVDGKVKLIRNESIGNYSWDSSVSSVNGGYGINQWGPSGSYEGADLMKLLNPGYDDNRIDGTSTLVNNSLYYNRQSGNCFNALRNSYTNCDFTTTGITNATKDNNLIADATWYLGGISTSNIYANEVYTLERGTNVVVPGTTCSGPSCNDTITRTTSWTGKGALMYLSDYGYAADLTKCGMLRVYDSSNNRYECRKNDWLYSSNMQWTITAPLASADFVWYVNRDGLAGSGSARYSDAVRPVYYLNSDAIIGSGDGSQSNPYQILVG